MGALLGVPEWLALGDFVLGALGLWLGLGAWLLRRAHRRVAARRPNPTEAETLDMMARDTSPEAARFVWTQALRYVEPQLTPHPDDDLIKDLCIDDDDLGMDWPQEWADQRGFSMQALPEWPKDWTPTVRNYARWLDLA
ncbi:hypothetical protein ACLBKU_05500 [Erythrobacter sp. NE805]|uniref:hypothetical protein n=1 Tax=Erythrobacter sp. NE805 TaxID=3389875 RepID=UPI00396B1A72